jgi:hypothetical protein
MYTHLQSLQAGYGSSLHVPTGHPFHYHAIDMLAISNICAVGELPGKSGLLIYACILLHTCVYAYAGDETDVMDHNVIVKAQMTINRLTTTARSGSVLKKKVT